tara:strand:- start:797 stop:1084 length:288 start_codon:yes stop_codon:yes gene_type:complete
MLVGVFLCPLSTVHSMSYMKDLAYYSNLQNLSSKALSEISAALMVSGSTDEEVSMFAVACLQLAGMPDTTTTIEYRHHRKEVERAEIEKEIMANA